MRAGYVIGGAVVCAVCTALLGVGIYAGVHSGDRGTTPTATDNGTIDSGSGDPSDVPGAPYTATVPSDNIPNYPDGEAPNRGVIVI